MSLRRVLIVTNFLRKYSTNGAPRKPFSPFAMPISPKYKMDLQRQRKRQKFLSTKYAPAKIWLQVVGSGGRGEPRAVVLCTDHTHYLFNGGEGTQRLAHEHHVKLTRLEHFFITRPTWRNMGGLPGLCLTVQETGVPQVTLHGPEGTRDLFKATEKFVILNRLNVAEADVSQNFVDQTMSVTYIPIVNEKISREDDDNVTITVDNTHYYTFQMNSNGKRSRDQSPSIQQVVGSVKRINSMMAFACKIHPKTGTLDIEKCVEKGVPAGPLLGKLKNGEDIILENGTKVLSSEVVSPSESGPLFLVVECPDEDWLEALERTSQFENYQMGTSLGEDYIAKYIVHFSPSSMIKNPRYINWMKKFGGEAEHILINEENDAVSSEAIQKMQRQHNLLHPTIFPMLGNSKKLLNQNSSPLANANHGNAINDAGLKLIKAETLQLVDLRPLNGYNFDSRVVIKFEDYVREAFDVEGFLDALAELQTDVKARTKSLGDTPEYPKLLMLGTGSSIPNKCRNTSGILLQISKDKSMVLDCGEGTVGQLHKFFGPSEIDEILKSIKVVYVSHLHADHHLGFIGIITERAQVTDEPLHLLAPSQMPAWLDYYDRKFESISRYYKFVSNRDLLYGQSIAPTSVMKQIYENLDLRRIVTCYVKHCPFSYGVGVTLDDGRTIVYSGDTIPTDNLTKIGKDCTVLIHEATMEDELESEAQLKMHSTISQAITAGQKMDADFTLLTHFSQRYSKIPIMDNKPHINPEKVGLAYDFMHISLSHLKLLPLFYPCMKIMYNEYVVALQEKNMRRELCRQDLSNAVSS